MVIVIYLRICEGLPFLFERAVFFVCLKNSEKGGKERMYKTVEQRREYQQRYYQKRRETILAQQKAYRQQNPEKYQQWRINAAKRLLERLTAQE